MSKPSSSTTCPRCGAALNENSIDGLCVSCLGAVNFATDTALPEQKQESSQPPFEIDQLSGHFPQLEILEFLGRGGMGVVYKARQKSLGRVVALKLMAPERANDPQFSRRFTQEARALAALSHPNIVTIHDFGEAGGFYYLLMEFVDGVNLRQAMSAGRLTPEQALAIVPPVCEALQYAHDHHIVHRDIKPENLLMDKEGRVKIADFGIAKMLGAESMADFAESQPAGTPQYMAPEQKLHLQTDHRADIYSLGVVLYEMLTGELPASNLQPPSKRIHVDVRIDEIVLRALEIKPELRFPSANEFRSKVETVTLSSVNSSPKRTEERPTSIYSPHALIGASWMLASLVAFFVTLVSLFSLRSGSQVITFPALRVLQFVVMVPSLTLALTGTIATTIFGWIAISNIRRSGTRIQGMRLAIFDALVFPLIAFNGIFVLAVMAFAKMFVDFYSNPSAVNTAQRHAALFTQLANWISANSDVVLLLAIATSVVISIVIIRTVKRSVSLPIESQRKDQPTVQRDNEAPLVIVASSLALMSFALGALSAGQSAERSWPLVLLSLLMASISMLVAMPARRHALGKLAIVLAGLSIMIWPTAAIYMANSQSLTATEFSPPQPPVSNANVLAETLKGELDPIGFRVIQVDHIPNSHKILMQFEIDDHSGLGLEFSQDVTASPDGKLPIPGYRDFQQKMFLGTNDARQFAWQLPEEFSIAETANAARVVMQRAKSFTQASEGALLEFANLKHPDGWTYTLLARVRRESGINQPNAPTGADLTIEKRIVVPADCLVRLQLAISSNDKDRQHIDRPLVFKTASDRATGFLIRWRTYGPSHPQTANSVLVDLVDIDTLTSYHRFRYHWNQPVRLRSLDASPLPERNESLMLAEPNSNSTIDLILAEKIALSKSDAAIQSWWNLSLEISNLGMRNENIKPSFQLPTIAQSESIQRIADDSVVMHEPSSFPIRNHDEWSTEMLALAEQVNKSRADNSKPVEQLIRWGEERNGLRLGLLIKDIVGPGQSLQPRLVVRNTSLENLDRKLIFKGSQLQLHSWDKSPKQAVTQTWFLLVDIPDASVNLEAGKQIELAVAPVQFGGSTLPTAGKPYVSNTDSEFVHIQYTWNHPNDPSLETGDAMVFINDQYASRSTVTHTLAFKMRNALARNMEGAIGHLLKGRPAQHAKASSDNSTLYVVAYNDFMKRVRTFITVNDATDMINRGDTSQYPTFSPTVTARSFFLACTIEDDEQAIADLLSVGVLAQLMNEPSASYDEFKKSGAVDPEWEAQLRSDWPHKRERILELVNQWNRFALVGIQESDAESNQNGETTRLKLTFLDAPVDEFYLALSRNATKPQESVETFHIDSLPPWSEVDASSADEIEGEHK